MLDKSTLGADIYQALGLSNDNAELLKDCESDDPGKVTELRLIAA
jgi:hypothetical protein